MARDIKILINGNAQRAEAELKRLQASGQQVASVLEREFSQLGIKSSTVFDAKREAANRAYERIKSSGLATADELARAEKALGDKLVALDSEQFGKRESLLQKFKQNWIGATVAIGAAMATVYKAWQLAESSAAGAQQRTSFANLAASYGASADQIISDLRRVSGATVSTQQLIEKSGTAMLLGIESKYLPKIMEISKASSKITGQTISKSFDDLSLAVARQSKMILDNLGIMLDVESANKDYAESLGKTSAQLNDVERKQAFLNAVMKEGQEIIDRVGAGVETEAEKFAKFSAALDDSKQSLGAMLSGPMSEIANELSATSGWFEAYRSGQIGFWEWMTTGADAAAERLKEINTTGLDKLVTAEGKELAQRQAAAKAAEAAAEAEKKLKDAVEKSTGALADYASGLKAIGKDQLRFADAGFAKDLELQSDYLEKNGKLATNLAQPLRSYLSVVGTVYDSQLAAQKQIAEILVTIGASQAEQTKQQITVAETEKVLAETRLKAWGSYYDKLRSMHEATLSEMKEKQDALLAVQQFGADLSKSISDKFTPAQALDPFEQFFADLDKVDKAQADAMALSGEKRVEALQKAMKMLEGIPTSVKSGDVVLISQAQALDEIMQRLTSMQTASEAAAQAEVTQAQATADALEAEMNRAKEAMLGFETTVVDLGAKIASLSQTITLSAIDAASNTVASVEAAIARLKDKTITITANYVSNVPSSVGGDASSGGSATPYAIGTSFVPKTGIYQLHRGEQVVPRGQVQNDNGSQGVTISGGINITMPNAQNVTQQTARDLARQVQAELAKLNRRFA